VTSVRHPAPTSSGISKSISKLRHPVYQAAFNIHTLKQAGEQAALALTLDSLGTDVCCVSETRIQDASTVVELTTPSLSTRFRLRISGDAEAAAVGYAPQVCTVPSHRAEVSLLDWIPVHNRPYALRLAKPKRPVPFAALATVENELVRLQQSGVIQPVNHSSWAAPTVVIKKANGKVRICADYSTGLNAVLDSHQYPLPVPEDLFTKLNGGRCFAKLDLADAYLQIEVSDDSKELLTINTHRGFNLTVCRLG
ncbi:hypothetical protein T265_13677, partial [Opisthorchis viverrini]